MKKYSLLILIVMLWGCKDKVSTEDSTSIETTSKSCSCITSSIDELSFFTDDFFTEFTQSNIAKIDIYKSKTLVMHKSSWKIDNTPYYFGIEEIEILDDLKKSRKILFEQNPEWTMVDYVKNTYKSMTKEEAERFEAILNEQLEKQKESTNDVEKNTQKTLQTNALEKEQNAYITIEGLGDYAVWNHKSNDLYVVCGDVLFTIRGQVGPWGKHDKNKGLELAKKVTTKIMNQCQ